MRVAQLLSVCAGALLVLAGPAVAAQTVISSSGPLTKIYLNDNLQCQVENAGDAYPEFFGSTASGSCGTLLYAGQLYGFRGTGFDPVSQTAVEGDGTSANPFRVVTTVAAGTGIVISQTDTYVVGDNFYRTVIRVENVGSVAVDGILYHGADCFLQESDVGYGYVDPQGGGVYCSANPGNSPAGRLEGFVGVTPGSHYFEGYYGSVYSIAAQGVQYPDTCDCSTLQDNGAGLSWAVSIPPEGNTTRELLTVISPRGALPGDQSDLAVSHTASPNPVATGATLTYEMTISNLGPSTAIGVRASELLPPGAGFVSASPPQGSCVHVPDQGKVDCDLGDLAAGGTITVPIVVQAPSAPGSVSAVATVSSATADPDQANNSATVTTTVVGTTPPRVLGAGVESDAPTTASFSATVDPGGLPTTGRFEYGLDPVYSGGGPVEYDRRTPPVSVGSEGPVTVFETATELVPNARYRVRFVATNARGTSTGPDRTFTTARAPSPPAPTLGETANLVPVSGVVFIRFPDDAAGRGAFRALDKGKGFVPLTQARQVPVGSQIDSRRGTLRLVADRVGPAGTQAVELGGAVFSVTQDRAPRRKGLTTIKLEDGLFPGAPTRKGVCAGTAGTGSRAFKRRRLSRRVLQTLRARDRHGNFRTRGRHSAGTVRGTRWKTVERCDGTLTVVQRGAVDVRDFGLRRTVRVRAGERYLAKAGARPARKRSR